MDHLTGSRRRRAPGHVHFQMSTDRRHNIASEFGFATETHRIDNLGFRMCSGCHALPHAGNITECAACWGYLSSLLLASKGVSLPASAMVLFCVSERQAKCVSACRCSLPPIVGAATSSVPGGIQWFVKFPRYPKCQNLLVCDHVSILFSIPIFLCDIIRCYE